MKNLQVRIKTDIATEPVSSVEAKLFCKVTTTADDTLFTILIKAARIAMEKYTSSSFAEKTIHATYLKMPEDNLIELPYGPVISVDAAYWVDDEGTEKAMVLNTDYYVIGAEDPRVKVASFWSSGSVATSSVRIEYTAGYGDTTNETLPAELKLAILKQVATEYEMREDVIPGGASVLSNSSKKHAAPYRRKLWF